MVSGLCRLIATTLFLAAGSAMAADVGRVLLAAGDTVAVREKQIIKLVFGSPVQDRDLLRTGPASNLQVRFIDEKHRMEPLFGEILDIPRDRVKDRSCGGRGRESEGKAKLSIEISTAEGDIVAVGEAKTGGREPMA